MKGLIYGSVCSGIEAVTVAWHPLGWRPSFFSEIEAFPRAVLSHHYPDVPLHGDFTTIENGQYEPIDLLVGGTPCQDFSIAGLRAGLVGDRGNLTLQFLKLAQRLRPQWIVWENVPGVLSSTSHVAPDPRPPEIDLDGDNGPRDGQEIVVTDEYDADESHALACFMAGLSELNYGFAARVLDAQYFGVPQRRRREFVVGYLGDWRPAAAVLFERESLSGNPAPSRKSGQAVAGTATAQSDRGRGAGTDLGLLTPPLTSNPYGDHESREGLLVAGTLQATSGGRTPGLDASGAAGGHLVAFGGSNTAGPIDIATALSSHGGSHGRQDFESETFITHALRGEGFDASEDGTGRGTPLVPVAMNLRGRDGGAMPELDDVACLRAASGGSSRSYIAFNPQAGGKQTNLGYEAGRDSVGTLGQSQTPAVAFGENLRGELRIMDIAAALQTQGGKPGQGYPAALIGTAVRRLTPRECERLQGFKDDYTLVPVKVKRHEPAGCGPCVKQIVTATVVAINGVHFVGTNHCEDPQSACPRLGMKTGEGYEMCRDICKQPAHAEVNALRLAGAHAQGGVLYVQGHTCACDACRDAAAEAGVSKIVVGAPPGNAADGPRYKALGNSMAVPCMSWIGERIEMVRALMTTAPEAQQENQG